MPDKENVPPPPPVADEIDTLVYAGHAAFDQRRRTEGSIPLLLLPPNRTDDYRSLNNDYTTSSRQLQTLPNCDEPCDCPDCQTSKGLVAKSAAVGGTKGPNGSNVTAEDDAALEISDTSQDDQEDLLRSDEIPADASVIAYTPFKIHYPQGAGSGVYLGVLKTANDQHLRGNQRPRKAQGDGESKKLQADPQQMSGDNNSNPEHAARSTSNPPTINSNFVGRTKHTGNIRPREEKPAPYIYKEGDDPKLDELFQRSKRVRAAIMGPDPDDGRADEMPLLSDAQSDLTEANQQAEPVSVTKPDTPTRSSYKMDGDSEDEWEDCEDSTQAKKKKKTRTARFLLANAKDKLAAKKRQEKYDNMTPAEYIKNHNDFMRQARLKRGEVSDDLDGVELKYSRDGYGDLEDDIEILAIDNKEMKALIFQKMQDDEIPDIDSEDAFDLFRRIRERKEGELNDGLRPILTQLHAESGEFSQPSIVDVHDPWQELSAMGTDDCSVTSSVPSMDSDLHSAVSKGLSEHEMAYVHMLPTAVLSATGQRPNFYGTPSLDGVPQNVKFCILQYLMPNPEHTPAVLISPPSSVLYRWPEKAFIEPSEIWEYMYGLALANKQLHAEILTFYCTQYRFHATVNRLQTRFSAPALFGFCPKWMRKMVHVTIELDYRLFGGGYLPGAEKFDVMADCEAAGKIWESLLEDLGKRPTGSEFHGIKHLHLMLTRYKGYRPNRVFDADGFEVKTIDKDQTSNTAAAQYQAPQGTPSADQEASENDEIQEEGDSYFALSGDQINEAVNEPGEQGGEEDDEDVFEYEGYTYDSYHIPGRPKTDFEIRPSHALFGTGKFGGERAEREAAAYPQQTESGADSDQENVEYDIDEDWDSDDFDRRSNSSTDTLGPRRKYVPDEYCDILEIARHNLRGIPIACLRLSGFLMRDTEETIEELMPVTTGITVIDMTRPHKGEITAWSFDKSIYKAINIPLPESPPGSPTRKKPSIVGGAQGGSAGVATQSFTQPGAPRSRSSSISSVSSSSSDTQVPAVPMPPFEDRIDTVALDRLAAASELDPHLGDDFVNLLARPPITPVRIRAEGQTSVSPSGRIHTMFKMSSPKFLDEDEEEAEMRREAEKRGKYPNSYVSPESRKKWVEREKAKKEGKGKGKGTEKDEHEEVKDDAYWQERLRFYLGE